MSTWFLCMMCGKEALDAYEYEDPDMGLADRGGPHWVYCRACDCWTEHPERDPAILPAGLGIDIEDAREEAEAGPPRQTDAEARSSTGPENEANAGAADPDRHTHT